MKRKISIAAAVIAAAVAASGCSKVEDIPSETVPEINSFSETAESSFEPPLETLPDSYETESRTERTKFTEGEPEISDTDDEDSDNVTEKLWTETNRSGTLSVRSDCFALEQALPDATPIRRYTAGSSVDIAALTDTGYYKLITGDYIRAENLIDIPFTTTAEPSFESVTDAETTASSSVTEISETTAVETTVTKKTRKKTETETSEETTAPNTRPAGTETESETVITVPSETEAPIITAPESSSETSVTATSPVTSETREVISNQGTELGISSLYKKDYKTRYAYNQFNEDQKTLYDNIVSAVKTLRHEMYAPENLTFNEIFRVYMTVFNQEAELFWMDGTVIITSDNRITISYKTEDKAEIEKMKGEIEAKASTLLASINAAPSTYDKLKIMYDFAVLNNEFSTSADGYNVSIYNSFTNNGELQCIGYAKTIQYLCDLAGIDSTIVIGTNAEGESHAWNVVYCDDGYYNLDSTWGDPINNFGSDYIRYTYFLVPDSWTHNNSHFNVNKFHRANEWIHLFNPPACTSDKENYFAREGKIYSDLKSADAALKQAFNEAVAEGSPIVEIRVTSSSVFDSIMKKAAEYQKYAKGLSPKVSSLARHSQDVYKHNGIVFFDINYS